jgi:hypothetical protein
MNDFERDNAWQRQVRDEILAPGFYGKYASDGRYVFVDKGRLATTLQRRYAVDTILQGSDGRAVCIDEKIVRWPGYVYESFCLETHSCTVPDHESDGWMRYGQADYLLYCFQIENGDLDSYLIDFPKLQAWFWPHAETYPEFQMRTLNRSAGRLVPIAEVSLVVPTWHFRIERPYDANDDFARSIEDCYRAVRERKASGEPGWEPPK